MPRSANNLSEKELAFLRYFLESRYKTEADIRRFPEELGEKFNLPLNDCINKFMILRQFRRMENRGSSDEFRRAEEDFVEAYIQLREILRKTMTWIDSKPAARGKTNPFGDTDHDVRSQSGETLAANIAESAIGILR